ncbi:MAG: preprotein translocase subunit SecG [Pseudomonadota bacterium]
MENVILIIHLLLAMALIAVVLFQRSEGGGLGIGGGGPSVSGRPAASPLAKVTWLLGLAFLITSVSLTIIVAQQTAGASVIDRLGVTPPPSTSSAPEIPSGDLLLPPSAEDSAPLVPAD